MKGTILDFSIQSNSGLIHSDEQNRYTFIGTEWRGARPPIRGDQVDFAVTSQGHAIEIYLISHKKQSLSQKIFQQLDKISNQNQIEENFRPLDWFVKGLKNYTNLAGRARRKEFWTFIVITIGLLVVAWVIDTIILGGLPLFYSLITLGLFLPTLTTAVRRMHDTGRSGWFLLVPLIAFYWLSCETKKESNQWGNPAK